jgi:hypothetical protein
MNNGQQGRREALESIHGKVWTAEELNQDFVVTAIIAPAQVVVRRKTDNQVGSMACDGEFYFNFQPQPPLDLE